MNTKPRPGRPTRDKTRDPYHDIRLRLTEDAYNIILKLAPNRQMLGKTASDLILANGKQQQSCHNDFCGGIMPFNINIQYLEYIFISFNYEYVVINDVVFRISKNNIILNIGLLDPTSGEQGAAVSSLCYIKTDINLQFDEDLAENLASKYNTHVLIPGENGNASIFRVFSICDPCPSIIINNEISNFVDFAIKLPDHLEAMDANKMI